MGEAFELTTDGVQREGTATSEDAYALMSAAGGLQSQHDHHRQFRAGSGKNSMTYQSGVASSSGNYYPSHNVAAATRREQEVDLWNDFKKHFGNK